MSIAAMVSEKGSGTQSAETRSDGNLPSCDDLPELPHAYFPSEHAAVNKKTFAKQPTTNKTPSRYATIAVAVIDEHSFTRESITRSLQDICNLIEVVSFATCDKCLENTSSYDVILYHAHESVASANNNGEELAAAMKRLLTMAPVIILCDVDS